MKILLFCLITSAINFHGFGQQSYPLLDFNQFQDKFHSGKLKKFNLEELEYDFNTLYELNEEEYYCFMQRPHPYSSAGVNPYYLYSIQSIDSNSVSVTIIHYKEALYTSMSLLTYDKTGMKTSETPVSVIGGDGAWWFTEKTEIKNDTILLSEYIESAMIEETDSSEVWSTKRAETEYRKSSSGSFRLVHSDTTIQKETKKYNYR